MKVTIFCPNPEHPVNKYLRCWIEQNSEFHDISIYREKSDLNSGDLLFLISCDQVVEETVLTRFKETCVIHSSDLPQGKGWSPHVWSIINGAENITVTALTASSPVDSGDIWEKRTIFIPDHALIDEINDILFKSWMKLMSNVCEKIERGLKPQPQPTSPSTYWPKRTACDSRLDPTKNLASQFNLLRICDPDRYPAFFDIRGNRYKIEIKKVKIQDDE